MELKDYQRRVLDEVRAYLQALAEEKAGRNPDYAAQEAWRRCGLDRSKYLPRSSGAGKDVPTFCLKVPTGGGKTLLATQVLAQAYKVLLPHRNGVGLVLWVVPSDQIYQDTLKALRDRNHPYRESLDFAVGRRVEVWEKEEISRLTPTQLASGLNILMLKLQGTSRKDRGYLKFFRDSGGNIVQHFPPEDDPLAHRALKQRVPNLDMVEDDERTGSHLAKTSLANLVRLCEPVVIVDEGQKVTSRLGRETIGGFNPCLVVELSATPPKDANILCRVTGEELLREQMIKLPIKVVASKGGAWQDLLTKAYDRRTLLAEEARKHHANSGKPLIRPIVLVQAERVGRDQRDEHYIHSEDIREYLVQRLGIDNERVRVKTSELNEIENLPLLDENCPVEWIITKSALQEGWDCPFAYILVSLCNMQSVGAMTQLVGRVLRQPFVEKTPFDTLNQSYVYCWHNEAAEVVDSIHNALRKEGYEGDMTGFVDRGSGDDPPPVRESVIRSEFRTPYRQPREGTILLPRFCVQTERGWELLDYYSHLLRGVDVTAFSYEEAETWDVAGDLEKAKEQVFTVSLNDDVMIPLHLREERLTASESDARAKAWLVANLDLYWYSAKRLRLIVDRVCERLGEVTDRLSLLRFPLAARIRAFVDEQTDRQTETIFKQLDKAGHIGFIVENRRCTFAMPEKVKRLPGPPHLRPNYQPVQKSLFDDEPQAAYDSKYEEEVAEALEQNDAVFWRHRNLVGRDGFSIQGWRRSLIYPDWIIQLCEDGKVFPALLILESKGKHLKGNADTEYKREVAQFFEKAGQQVHWQELVGCDAPHTFRFHILNEGDYFGEQWRDELKKLLKTKGYEPVLLPRK